MKEHELKCNKCGKTLDIFDINNAINIKTTLGYGSKYDSDKINLILCCGCLDEIIDSCINSPIISE